ncbi:hypothetical protein CPter91_0965 [Collimonas pratensis]|uniref:Uncharacterized protein n=1 Tax=Collimonas pratensis TaxID=279113 RepID=A0A127PZZ5_9BURK|nr:hypothetical protein CPter91_0965 [Collimonas pratensis]
MVFPNELSMTTYHDEEKGAAGSMVTQYGLSVLTQSEWAYSHKKTPHKCGVSVCCG